MKEQKQFDNWVNDIEHFKLPRWEELASVPLYMDQLISLVKEYLAAFKLDDNRSMEITSSMVNNYVKLGLMPKPIKKRYNRRHIAYLIIITLFKQVISIHEIRRALVYMAAAHGNIEAYNQFCDYLEIALRKETQHYRQGVISINESKPYQAAENFDEYLIWTACLTITNLVFSRRLIECVQEEDMQLDEGKISH